MPPWDEPDRGAVPAPEGLERFARDLRAELLAAAERDVALTHRCRAHGSERAARPPE